MLTTDAIMRDCVQAVINVRNVANTGTHSPESACKHVREHVDKMMGKALAAGMSREEVQLMTFALVALADHLASKTQGASGEFWSQQPLQTHYFPGKAGAQTFFEQLDKARKEKSLAALRAYALAIALGYRGHLSLLDAEKLLADLVQVVEPAVVPSGPWKGLGTARRLHLQDAHLAWVPAGALLAGGALYLLLSSIMGHDAAAFLGWIDTLMKVN